VQDAWLRFNRYGADGVDNLGGWLTTIVARVCLNMLRSRNLRREEQIGFHEPHSVDRLTTRRHADQNPDAGRGRHDERRDREGGRPGDDRHRRGSGRRHQRPRRKKNRERFECAQLKVTGDCLRVDRRGQQDRVRRRIEHQAVRERRAIGERRAGEAKVRHRLHKSDGKSRDGKGDNRPVFMAQGAQRRPHGGSAWRLCSSSCLDTLPWRNVPTRSQCLSTSETTRDASRIAVPSSRASSMTEFSSAAA